MACLAITQLSSFLKSKVLELVICEAYTGFRPTFMCEKPEQLHNIKISVECTRQLMIESEVWRPKNKKCPVVHQQRKRRACFGELIQIDGSPGKFVPSETTAAYMTTTREYIMKYGRPLAFYSDRHAIFRINKPGCLKRELLTQFGRAANELDIGLLWANSPQVNGRVERANQTHQDRLIKELRLAGISTIDAANKFLDGYWEMHNEKFNVPPLKSENAHRALLSEQDLNSILCFKEYRKLSKNLELQYKNVIYQSTCEKTILEALWSKSSYFRESRRIDSYRI